MKDFNARELITRGKKGYTFDEVAVLYNLSPEALKAKMDKAFLSSAVNSMMRQFDQNSKRKLRQHVNEDTCNLEISSVSEVSELHEDTHCDCNEIVTVEYSKCEQSESIESVKNDIELLHSSIFENEVLLKRLVKERKEKTDAMHAIKIELGEFKSRLQLLSSDFEELVAKRESIQESISQVNSDNSFLWEELQAAELKLQELMTVTIFVYSNGTIEAENFQEFEKYHVDADLNSYKSDKFENLTVKQIRQLDFLQRITRVLNKDNRAFEIIFDSSELENAWSIMQN